ncbi:MAG: hypothetical protein OXU36_10530 [Candidatus Poribacteria bacterium]|nr:hypothetical protein [Candidatus Poribacteria bacterium]
MPSVKIEIHGLERILRALDKEELKPFLLDAGKKAVAYVVNIVRRYPFANPRQARKRTGRLGKGWKGQIFSDGTGARAINKVPYAHIVHGGTESKPFFEAQGWVQVSHFADERHRKELEIIYEQALEDFVKDVEAKT